MQGHNYFGQLGDGTNTARNIPTAVASNLTFTALPPHGACNGGIGTTCAVASTADLYCFGYNSNGQLGDGTQVTRNAPTRVLGGLSWKSVAIGHLHVCGITTAYRAFCWVRIALPEAGWCGGESCMRGRLCTGFGKGADC